VRGIPDPAAKADQLNLGSDGLLSDLAQSGWRISVLGYTRVGANDLPSRLLLAAGDVKIRLVIDRWELPKP
jgi:outer membrane biogenesis lipoprotein LolB